MDFSVAFQAIDNFLTEALERETEVGKHLHALAQHSDQDAEDNHPEASKHFGAIYSHLQKHLPPDHFEKYVDQRVLGHRHPLGYLHGTAKQLVAKHGSDHAAVGEGFHKMITHYMTSGRAAADAARREHGAEYVKNDEGKRVRTGEAGAKAKLKPTHSIDVATGSGDGKQTTMAATLKSRDTSSDATSKTYGKQVGPKTAAKIAQDLGPHYAAWHQTKYGSAPSDKHMAIAHELLTHHHTTGKTKNSDALKAAALKHPHHFQPAPGRKEAVTDKHTAKQGKYHSVKTPSGRHLAINPSLATEPHRKVQEFAKEHGHVLRSVFDKHTDLGDVHEALQPVMRFVIEALCGIDVGNLAPSGCRALFETLAPCG